MWKSLVRVGRAVIPPAAECAAGSGGRDARADAARAIADRIAKAMADLVPLADLASGETRSAGATPRVRPAGADDPGSTRQSDDGSEDGTPGPLPFTGLALITLALVGCALVGLGARLRRSAASTPPVPAAPPPLEPAAPAPTPAPTRTHRSSALPLLALLGLAAIALLAVRPGRPS